MSDSLNLAKLFPPPTEAHIMPKTEDMAGVRINYMSIRNLPFAFDTDRMIKGVEAQMQFFMPYTKFTLGMTEAHDYSPPMKILSIKLRESVNIHRLLEIFEEPVAREFDETGINPQTLIRPFEFRFDTDQLGYNKVRHNQAQGQPRAGL